MDVSQKSDISFCKPLSVPAQLDGVGQLRTVVTPGEPLKKDVMHFLLYANMMLTKGGAFSARKKNVFA